MFQLNVGKVTTKQQKLPKMGQKKQTGAKSLPQELEVGPRSGQYLLVIVITFFRNLNIFVFANNQNLSKNIIICI